jgi:hypothetical protein
MTCVSVRPLRQASVALRQRVCRVLCLRCQVFGRVTPAVMPASHMSTAHQLDYNNELLSVFRSSS